MVANLHHFFESAKFLNIERAQTGGAMMQMPDMTGGISNEQPQYEQTPQQGGEEARELPSGYENRGFESSDYGLNQKEEHPEEPEQEKQIVGDTPVEYEQKPQEESPIFLGAPINDAGIGRWNDASEEYDEDKHLYIAYKRGDFCEFYVIREPHVAQKISSNFHKYLYPCCDSSNKNYNPEIIVTDRPGEAQYDHTEKQWIVMNKAKVHYE